MVAWVGGFKQGKPNSENLNRTQGFWGTERAQIRRSSTKDVEEAMSGGLSTISYTQFIFFFVRHICTCRNGLTENANFQPSWMNSIR